LTGGDNIKLGEAARRFLAGLPEEKRVDIQQEIYRFVRWYGWEQPFVAITPPQVANYAEHLSQSDTDFTRKLARVRVFLTHAKKQGWSSQNLAVHLKARKTRNKALSASMQKEREPVLLTKQRYEELQAELAALKEKRPQLIEDIRRAAADKDFRENAPLDAAKEQRGHLEGRIMELEETLAAATIIDGVRENSHKVILGDTVVLQDIASGAEVCYTLVNPNEVNPSSGKISDASPIGKAILGTKPGDLVEITVPAGKLRYKIVRIGD